MKIRKATIKDANEVSKIFLVETTKKPYVQEWTKRTALEKIKDLFEKEDIFVLEEEQIIGFLTVSVNMKKKEIYVDELWLSKESQGKGFGTALMNFVEKEYKKRGIKTVTLMANQKARAIEFYEKLNYKVKHKFIYFVTKL